MEEVKIDWEEVNGWIRSWDAGGSWHLKMRRDAFIRAKIPGTSIEGEVETPLPLTPLSAGISHLIKKGDYMEVPFDERYKGLSYWPKDSGSRRKMLGAMLYKEIQTLRKRARAEGMSYKESAELIAHRGWILSRLYTNQFWGDPHWDQGIPHGAYVEPEPDKQVDATRDVTSLDQSEVENPLSRSDRALDDQDELTRDIIRAGRQEGDISQSEIDQARARYTGTINELPYHGDEFVPYRRDSFLLRKGKALKPMHLAELLLKLEGDTTPGSGTEGVGAKRMSDLLRWKIELEKSASNIKQSKEDGTIRESRKLKANYSRRYPDNAWFVGDRLLDLARAVMLRGGDPKGEVWIDPSLLEGYENEGMVNAIKDPDQHLRDSIERESAYLYYLRSQKITPPLQQEEETPQIPETAPTSIQSRIPMNFSYGEHGLPGNKKTTFDEIFEGQRRSTLRRKGQHNLNIGDHVEVFDKSGRTGVVVIKGSRPVDSSMAEELSQTERWTPEFIKNYIKEGDWVQFLYEPVPTQVPAVPEVAGNNISRDPISQFYDLDPNTKEIVDARRSMVTKLAQKNLYQGTLAEELRTVLALQRRNEVDKFGSRLGPLQYRTLIRQLGEEHDINPRELLLVNIPQFKEITTREGAVTTGFAEFLAGNRTSLVMTRLAFQESGRGQTELSYEELLKEGTLVRIHGKKQEGGDAESSMRLKVAGVRVVEESDLEGLSERTDESLESLRKQFETAQALGEPLIEINLQSPTAQDDDSPLEIGEMGARSATLGLPGMGREGYFHYPLKQGDTIVGDIILRRPEGDQLLEVKRGILEDTWDLLFLKLDPEYQGSGLGMKWLEAEIDKALERGVSPTLQKVQNKRIIEWAKKKGGKFSDVQEDGEVGQILFKATKKKKKKKKVGWRGLTSEEMDEAVGNVEIDTPRRK